MPSFGGGTLALGLIIAAVFVAGYATQRGTTCAVIAARRLTEGRPERLLGFVLCAAVATLVLAIARDSGGGSAMVFGGFAATPMAALGGAIIGWGAWLNGRCAMGTIAGLGSGDLHRIGTLTGYLGGAALASALVPVQHATASVSPLATQSPLLIGGGAAAIAALAVLIVSRRPDEPGAWPLALSMPLVGLMNGGLTLASAGWAWTALVGDVAMGHWMGTAERAGLFMVLIGGAVMAALVSGSFRLTRGSRRQWQTSVAGGALMGVGTIIVPGGNDTMLMVGLPLLIPHLLTGYIALYVTLFVLIRTEQKVSAASA